MGTWLKVSKVRAVHLLHVVNVAIRGLLRILCQRHQKEGEGPRDPDRNVNMPWGGLGSELVHGESDEDPEHQQLPHEKDQHPGLV